MSQWLRGAQEVVSAALVYRTIGIASERAVFTYEYLNGSYTLHAVLSAASDYQKNAPAGERALSKHEYLTGLRVRTRCYQRLQTIVHTPLPVRERSPDITISAAHHIACGGTISFRLPRT